MTSNIFKLGSDIMVTFEDGTQFKSSNCTDEFYKKVLNFKDDKDKMEALFYPDNPAKKVLRNKLQKSSIITIKDNSAYIPSISKLSMPQMLVERIIAAEENNDENALTAYKNFWTLLSLNPNSAVRDNLFWFLNKWGMSICKSGLFVAYRNAVLKEEGVKFNQELTKIVSQEYFTIKNNGECTENYSIVMSDNAYKLVNNNNIQSDELVIGNLRELYETMVSTNGDAGTVYTDQHSGSTRIRIGHIVSIPRSECDEDSEISCSRGLHVAGKYWLTQNYFGNTALKVLVNPADCCAAPKIDSYGKLRTCAYYPIQIVNFENGKITDNAVQDGFEIDFMCKICYTGEINNEDFDNYKLNLPKDIGHEDVYNNLRNIALSINRKI